LLTFRIKLEDNPYMSKLFLLKLLNYVNNNVIRGKIQRFCAGRNVILSVSVTVHREQIVE